MRYFRKFVCYSFLFLLLGASKLASDTLPADKNPFLSMISKPYAQYAQEMKEIRNELDFHMEQPQADSLMEYMRQAAKIAGNTRWKLEAALFETTYLFRHKTRNDEGNNYTSENLINDYIVLVKQAQEANDTLMRLRVQHDLMNAYYHLSQNYALAFDIAIVLKQDLLAIAIDKYPDKLHVYSDIARMYYHYSDYEEVEELYKRIAAEPQVANQLQLLQTTYNTLGLIQYYHHNDPDAADEYFRMIIQIAPTGNEPEGFLSTWEGVAYGNIGRGLYLRNRYSEAIPLLQSAFDRIVNVSDYPFGIEMAIMLANIYIEQEETGQCKYYIDRAGEYYDRFYHRLSKEMWYEVTSRYYTTIGDRKQALAYMDSTFYSRQEYDKDPGALELKRSEQRAHILKQTATDEELRKSHLRTEKYRRIVFIAGITLLLAIGILVSLLLFYRRRRNAHRSPARKTTPLLVETTDEPAAAITQAEEQLMQRIRRLMEEERAFTDPNLTLAEIAVRLEINRTYISATINRCTGHSFSNYINEFRVNEAIRIMSAPENNALTIDAVAYSSGFNDRHSFYRAFKRITGSSPSVFRTNLTTQK